MALSSCKSLRLEEVPGGVVGVNDDHGAGTGGDRVLQRMEINLPSMVVEQTIGQQLYVLNIGKEIEQRIARRGHQDFVARIAKHAKDEGVGFAGARREHDVLDGDVRSMLRIIFRDRSPSRRQALRIRMVLQGVRMAERIENGLAVIEKTSFCGIRDSQIDQRAPGGAMPGEGFAQAIGCEIPFCALSKHGRNDSGANIAVRRCCEGEASLFDGERKECARCRTRETLWGRASRLRT